MQDYRYKHGDRPLEGFTIERAAGRGGFGEVYYAVSDSGRQVALKMVQNHEQIELRGIKECMNLKSPNLVTIFDVKYNEKGRPFVIMEFVSGMSLRDLLDEHPEGIGTQKAAFFLREIAKGLSHLHECGIVHRDLKPGNIFYENGIVKIGDYGLAKAISTSQHSGQTVTVGTVHYMAPEIGEGRYDCSIDIYALGILLYEMLTGQVPFFGASPAEVLMKHLSAEPQLEGLDDTFKRVIRKALAKNPADRYQTVQEMVEDVFGTEHIRNSVSQFSPESLSMVAERVARNAQKVDAPPPSDREAQPAGGNEFSKMGEQLGRQLGAAGGRFAEKVTNAAAQFENHLKDHASGTDPVSRHQRRMLTLITIAVVSAGTGLLGSGGAVDDALPLAVASFLTILGAIFGMFLAKRKLLRNFEPGAFRNLMGAGLGILGALLFSGFIWARLFPGHINPGGTLLAIAILGFADWWSLTEQNRKDRIRWAPVIRMAILGFFVALVTSGEPAVAAGIIAGILLAIQVASPFGAASQVPPPSRETPKRPRESRWHSMVGRFRASRAPAAHPPTEAQPEARPQSPPPAGRTHFVSSRARIAFLILSILSLGTGLCALIITANSRMRGEELAFAVSLGICALIGTIFWVRKGFQRQFTSWYRYLVKPLLLLLCLFTVISTAVVLGNTRLHGDEEIVAIFLIVFPAILFFVIWLMPNRLIEDLTGQPGGASPSRYSIRKSPQKRLWALLLALIWPFPCGGHRIYVGKVGTGILWFFTGGMFGIGQLVDIILILAGRFRDAEGRHVLDWIESSPNSQPASSPPPPPAAVPPAPRSSVDQDPGEGAPPPKSEPAPPKRASLRASGHGSRVWTAVEQFNPIGSLFSVLGHFLLLVAVIVGLFDAANIHWLVASGFPGPEINREIQQALSYAVWPDLIDRLIPAVCIALVVAGAMLIVIGRRARGGAHMFRAAAGSYCLLRSLFAIGALIPTDYFSRAGVMELWQNEMIGQAIDSLLDAVNTDALSGAGLFLLASVALLAWPAKRRRPAHNGLDPVDAQFVGKGEPYA